MVSEVHQESPSCDEGPSCDDGVCTNWKHSYDHPKVHDPTLKPNFKETAVGQEPTLTNPSVGIIPSLGASPLGQPSIASTCPQDTLQPLGQGRALSFVCTPCEDSEPLSAREKPFKTNGSDSQSNSTTVELAQPSGETFLCLLTRSEAICVNLDPYRSAGTNGHGPGPNISDVLNNIYTSLTSSRLATSSFNLAAFAAILGS